MWTWLRQVHGARVVTVRAPGEAAGEEADAAVVVTPGCTVAVRTADCAPLVLLGRRSAAVAHLGWRGLAADLVARTVEAMHAVGDPPTSAHLGPCIRPSCYEFGAEDLRPLVVRFGPAVEGRTTAGRPALDLPAAVRSAVTAAGVDHLEDSGRCTACSPGWFSHRARGERGRFATAVWIEA